MKTKNFSNLHFIRKVKTLNKCATVDNYRLSRDLIPNKNSKTTFTQKITQQYNNVLQQKADSCQK